MSTHITQIFLRFYYLLFGNLLMLQPLGVECIYLHKAQLGLYVYNVGVRATYVEACMDERVAKALHSDVVNLKKYFY